VLVCRQQQVSFVADALLRHVRWKNESLRARTLPAGGGVHVGLAGTELAHNSNTYCHPLHRQRRVRHNCSNERVKHRGRGVLTS